MKFLVLLCLTLAVAVHSKTIQVSNAGQLSGALNSVNPGDTINLADGNYHGSFVATRSGDGGAKITLTGSQNAIISGNSYGFNLKANNWVLNGFSVVNSLKGIVLDGASNNVLQNLHVRNIKQEGIHLRASSSDNIIQSCNIHDTGTQNPGFGEGIYIGQAVHNWLNGQQDRSDRNQVLNNRLGPNVRAECFDIKEGSCCGVIRGNTCNGNGESGQNYAESALDVKGDDYTIEDNTADHPLKNGFEIHHIAAANVGGCNNRIQNNRCPNLPSGGKCAVSSSKSCSNTLTNNN